mgnify:CR=1 FL=1
MTLIDLSIEERGFVPLSIGLAVRTIGSCFAMRHRPDDRILTGIGLLAVRPDDLTGYRFEAVARCLTEGETAADLLDWLEEKLPEEAAIISWHNWGSVPRRLAALADAERHPRLSAAANDTAGRWRDLPRGHTWHLRQAPAQAMPCLCPPGVPVDECQATTPVALLPDPEITAWQLIGEAIAGWQCWARGFGAFDDDRHPAVQALRELHWWRTGQPPTVPR